jgi:phosphoribosylformylglycinamidine synthase subunit PurS
VFRAFVRITLRPSILDPQGKAIRHALHNLGYEGVEDVRAGKLIELTLAAGDAAEAERMAREAAERLLANPVMEDFTVEIVPAGADA